MSKRKFDEASTQIDIALEYDPSNLEARLIRAQLCIWRREYPVAVSELETYLRLNPDDRNSKELLALAKRAEPGDGKYSAAFANVFLKQGAFYFVEALAKDNQKLLAAYNQRLRNGWPDCDRKIRIGEDGGLQLHLYLARISDLSALEGVPLTFLNLQQCRKIRDLSPLKGMPLNSLDLSFCNEVGDLVPLEGMPLTELRLRDCRGVSDLTPLGDMRLTLLDIRGCRQVDDLTPLKGMPLKKLFLSDTRVSDLTPLTGMSLTNLHLYRCEQLSDLTPLKGMPLIYLNLQECGQVKDLTPLKGMALQELHFTPKKISVGMETIRQMESMVTVSPGFSTKLPTKEFWRRYDAGEFKK